MNLSKAWSGIWNQSKGQLQQRFAMLRNNSQYLLEGKNTEAFGRFQTSESMSNRHLANDDYLGIIPFAAKKMRHNLKFCYFRLNWVIIFASAILMGVSACSSPKKKVENAQEDVIESEENLELANKEYLEDMENYKVETKKKIKENEKAMADFKERIKTEKADVKADYEIKIAELEKKNSDFTLRMDNYKADGRESWDKFKSEMSHDMEELGKAFKDLTVKNVK